MSEPRELQRARELLARAEAAYRSEDGLAHVEGALALLDDVIESGGAGEHKEVARNLASTYADRIISRVAELVENDPGLPEPEMERFFRLVLAFDDAAVEPPAAARSVKIRLARRLLDRYYEGCPPRDKQKALQELAGMTGGGGKQGRRG